MSAYLTTSTASSTYQTQSAMASYLTTSTASSTYQTQSAMSSYPTLSGNNTLSGSTTFTGQTTLSRSVERVQAPTLSTSTISYDFNNGAIGYVTPASTTGLTLNATNVPITGSNQNVSSCSFTLILNTTTNKTWVTTLTVNGTACTIQFAGGSSNVSVTGANFVAQTFSILSLPGESTTVRCLSSVVACS